MRVSHVLAVVTVADFETAACWYERLLGRPPDRLPMEGCAEWQLTRDGGLQLVRDAERSGSSFVTLGVEDLELHLEILAKHDFYCGPITTGHIRTGETIRISRITDPDGNIVTFGEEPETRPKGELK